MLLAHLEADVPPPLTALRLVTDWAVEPVAACVLVALAGLYLAGVRRLSRRGDRWPVARSVSFLAGGLGSVAIAAISGLAAYDDVLFSAHMAQHMLLTMIAPVFLALGAPITLALRTLPMDGRRRLLAVLHSRVARVMMHPLVGTFLFIASPFVLYFSPIYEATLRSEFWHVVLHGHLLAVGCLFLWPVLGLDPLPHRLPHLLRLVLVFITVPFHAFLGVAILSQNSVIAGHWYAGLHRTWGGTPLADQHTGGGLLWAAGEIASLLLVGCVAVQWMQADEREAQREDRRLDRLEQIDRRGQLDRLGGRTTETGDGENAEDPEDAALAAYNARLRALSRRSTTRAGEAAAARSEQ